MKLITSAKNISGFALILFLAYNGNGQTYSGTQAGKPLKSWYIAGPVKISNDTSVIPDNTAQEEFFNRKDNQNANVSFTIPSGSTTTDLKNWKKFDSKNDIIDFDSIFKKVDYASAYAYAVIVQKEAGNAILGIGSDDAVKVWHNGKLVHKNWRARAIVPDEDIIQLPLVKGKNEILVEVQDIAGGWGFTARFLDQKGITKRLIKSASLGDLDETKRMIDAGADVNGKGENSQSALDAARINGRGEVADLLVSKGARNEDVPSPEKLIEGLYSPLNSKENPGIALLVSKDGKIIYNNAFGYADIEHKVKVTPETKFRIGSITKQFIGSAILKLQEDGKLSVKDKLSKYFPDFPRADEVTIHQLLTHTSGIHSFTNKDSFFVDVVKPVTTEKLYNYFKNDPYDFNPGERYQYNNSGYFLLGYIIEKITGDNFGVYLKKEFFDPLGMTNTGVHSPKLNLTNEALGYEKNGEKISRALNWNMDWAAGAGSLYSTVGDLYKWNEAVFNNIVLSPESMKAAFTPVVLNNGSLPPGVEYGYGWGLNKYRGISSVSHSGGLHGFISQLLRVQKENMTVVMLTNVSPPQGEMDPMKIAELYLWKEMDKQSSFAQQQTQEKDVDKYTGRYDFTNGMVMTISKEGDGLYAQMSGQSKFPIFPSSPGHFFWKVVDAKINFITDPQGNVTHGHFEQGSFKVDAPKMKDLVFVKPDISVLEQYKGIYKLKEGTNIAVTLQDGRLYGQATGDARYELLALSDTEFIITDLNATLTFSKDASGKVSSVHLKVSGDERDAPKIE